MSDTGPIEAGDTSETQNASSGSLHPVVGRRFATGYVLSEQKEWGNLSLTHGLAIVTASTEDEARGIAFRDAQDKYPSAKVEMIGVLEIKPPNVRMSDAAENPETL